MEVVCLNLMLIRKVVEIFYVFKLIIFDKVIGRSEIDVNIGWKLFFFECVENKIVENVVEVLKRGMGVLCV